jgi:hypothetical protein
VSEEQGEVGAVDPKGGVEAMIPSCPWCNRPVEREGETCGLECYSCYATYMAMRLVSSAGVVMLDDDDELLLDLTEQPWYALILEHDEEGTP